MPVLLARHFKPRDALGLVTGAGSLWLLFPPCLPLILYAVVAKVPIKDMFLGGVLPGAVLLVATAVWGIFAQGPVDADAEPAFNWAVAEEALWQAKWELLMPAVALGALFGGFATPVEAAALTALYAFSIEVFVYRELKLTKDVPRVMAECGLLVGGVLLIQGVALGFTNYLVDAEVTARAVEWATTAIHSRWIFLLALNLFLLVVGCLMEIYAAIVVQAPMLVPIGAAFGINPIHLGIIFLANLEARLPHSAGWIEPAAVFLSIQQIRTRSAARRYAVDAGARGRSAADHVYTSVDDGVARMVRPAR